MASGFPDGGGAAFYGGIPGRFMVQNTTPTTNNPSQPLPSPYRTAQPQQQLPLLFLDQTTPTTPLHQIPPVQHRLTPTPTLIGKRTLAEFQAAQHQQQLLQQQLQQQPNNLNPALSNLLLHRCVKPRNMIQYQHTSPISTLSPVELSPSNNNNLVSPDLPSLRSTPFHPQRYPLLQRQQPQQQLLQLRAGMINNTRHLLGQEGTTNLAINHTATAVLQNQNRGMIPVGFQQQDFSFSAEKKMMVDKRLRELEKQLLDEEEEGNENDIASVITNIDNHNATTSTIKSEWSDTIHNLNIMASTTPSNPISPSPTSSSSSSSSVTNPVPNCTRQTLVEVASAISDSKNDAALEILSRFSLAACIPNANPEQKLVDFLGKALKSRINPVDDPVSVAAMFSKEHAESTQSLFELCPCFKLGFIAANLAILDAARDHDAFHVVDFDVGQGGQYVNLLHALSSARGNNGKVPSVVKLTAVQETSNGNCITVNEEKERLREVGEMLTRLGERVGVYFRFSTVSLNKLSDLTRDSLGVEKDEALVVNFAFKLFRVPDESVSIENPRDELLRRVKGLCPVVVTLVEQEMNVNTAPFMSRVNEVCSYYGALLESMEARVARENSERAKAEKGIGRRIVNSVACEGRERVERCEVFGKWRARFGMAGFGLKPTSQGVAESIRARLDSGNWANPGFTVIKEESGGVCFGWKGKCLTVASAWR